MQLHCHNITAARAADHWVTLDVGTVRAESIPTPAGVSRVTLFCTAEQARAIAAAFAKDAAE
jgi:hypothetical protein